MPSSTSSSDPRRTRIAGAEQENYERVVPPRRWLSILLAALLMTGAATAAWELYWRAHWYRADDYNNGPKLWAQERRRAVGDATVLIGSSRQLFDIDLGAWEETSQRGRPIQLALEGTSPRPFLSDLAADRRFHGLVVVDVMPQQFFAARAGLKADYIEEARRATPSDRIDHWLSMQLERYLAFIDDSTRPKVMINEAQLPLRAGMAIRHLPRTKIEEMAADRDGKLWRRLVEDRAYREEAEAIWSGPRPAALRRPPPTDVELTRIIAEVNANIAQIRARGGDVVFVRHPFSGFYAKMEPTTYPRARYWDRLIADTQAIGVTFEDHPELQGFVPLEWSHLHPDDRAPYTQALVKILYSEIDRRRDPQARGEPTR